LCVLNLSTTDLTDIGFWAFRYCSRLREVIFPPTLERLDDGCFCNCGLERVQLGHVTRPLEFGLGCFESCRSLVRVTLSLENGDLPTHRAMFTGCAIEELTAADWLPLNSLWYRGAIPGRLVSLRLLGLDVVTSASNWEGLSELVRVRSEASSLRHRRTLLIPPAEC
jgi:hypothetical protein